MKTLTYQKPNNLSQLCDELTRRVPALAPRPAGEFLEPVIRVEGKGDEVVLTVPDDADEEAIRAVVEAHTPASTAPTPTTADIIAAIAGMNLEGATTVAGLKEVIAPIRDAAAAVLEAGAS